MESRGCVAAVPPTGGLCWPAACAPSGAVATAGSFLVPVVALLSGTTTSTVNPFAFLAAFTGMWLTRLWGAKLLMRRQIQWRTAYALGILRIPIGIAFLRWLTRQPRVAFDVTPKGGSHTRSRGRVPGSILALSGFVAAVLGYSLVGLAGPVPRRADAASTVAADAWFALAARRPRARCPRDQVSCLRDDSP